MLRILSNLPSPGKTTRVCSYCCCCCFSTGTLQGDECSRTGLCRYHPTAQLHHGFPEDGRRWLGYSICIGELFDYSCSVELAGSYLGHVPCKFWKVCLGLKYLPQINYGGKLTCLGCSPRIGYHWFGVLVKWACSFCVSGSQHQWSVIWMLLWEVLVVVPCQMAL